MLSRDDIRKAIETGSLRIYPFEPGNLTGIGYNLSTTYFAFSIGRGDLLTVHVDRTSKGDEHYVLIPPNDTVLLFSREFVAVDATLAGSFHSKVSCVCQGLGHVSTTLDPTWAGQLIISVNNPMADEVKFYLDKSGGNAMTLLLSRLDTEVTGPGIHDNNSGRCDMILARFAAPPRQGSDKGKYADLRKFVVREYAASLNGCDDFLNDKGMGDGNDVGIERLQALRERLRDDRAFIGEQRYLEEPIPNYAPLKFGDEESLIEGCMFVRACGGLRGEMLEPGAVCDSTSAQEALDKIDYCLRAVDYELDAINHSRRVTWQNEKVLGFALEETDLDKERRTAARRRFYKDRWPSVVAAAVFFALAAVLVAVIAWGICHRWESVVLSALCAFLAPVASIAAVLVSHLLSEHRREKGRWVKGA